MITIRIPAITAAMAAEYAASNERFILITEWCDVSTNEYDDYPAIKAAVDAFEDAVEDAWIAAQAPNPDLDFIEPDQADEFRGLPIPGAVEFLTPIE